MSKQLNEQTNLHLMYIAFLVVIALGVFAIVSIDTSDKGECKRSVTGGLLVREPGTQTFVEREFCIIIYN